MQELESRNNTVITDASRWGAGLILDVEDYVKEAEKQINSKENYRKLYYDPTTASIKTIHKVMPKF